LKVAYSVFATIIAVLLLFSALSSVTNFTRTGSSADSSTSGQLTIGYTNEATDPFNLITFGDLASYMTNYLIYDSLLQQDGSGNLLPAIAQNWTISSDGLTYTFNLNPNATFSDGHQLTSQDVLYTYELVANYSLNQYFDIMPIEIPASNNPTGVMLNASAVQTPNNETIVFHLTSVYVPFLILGFTSFGVFEQSVVQGKNLTTDTYFDQNLSAVVGAGPFGKVLAYQPGQYLTLGANPYFFVKGEPHLSQVTFKVFNSISDEEVALKSGEINFVGGGADMQGIDPWDVPLFNSTAGLTSVSELSVAWYQIAYNMAPHLQDGSFNPVSIRNVRQALYEGFNETGAISSVFGNLAILANQPEAPLETYGGLTAHDPNLPNPLFPFNVTDANKLLNESGYLWTPNSGNVSNGAQYRFSLSFYVPSGYDALLRVAELFQSEITANIGINIQLQLIPYSTLVYDIYGGSPVPKAWNMMLNFWDPTPGEPDLALYQWWAFPGNTGAYGLDGTGYNDSTYNNLINEEHDTTNPQQRQQIFWQIDQQLASNITDLFLYYPDYILTYQNQYQGWLPGVQLDVGALTPNSLAQVYISSTTTTASSTTGSLTSSSTGMSTQTTTTPTSSSSNSSLYLIIAGIVIVVVVIVGALMFMRSRRGPNG
jgi:peptide/nickel transport system substrate-binding protein